ncbi:MAG: hypothetical protein Q4F47_06055 [Bacteroidaceae bacterium]|nr:hypothetical protein [Bacteroidaceae bacterium]
MIPKKTKKSYCILLLCWAILGLWGMKLCAMPLPQSKPTHIEVRHEWTSGRLIYFWLTDIYTKEEQKIRSEIHEQGVATLDFNLYHPLYDEMIPANNQRIPFYVEPGDSLVIHVKKDGSVEKYEYKNGSPVKYETLLRHDISNRTFYTHKDFATDKEQRLFPDFATLVQKKMQTILDSVDHVAERYSFSAEERNLARCNVQMQFALWIFEYAPMKVSELLNYANLHEEGWQSLPEQDKEIAAILDAANYRFMAEMHPNDSTYLASKFFPAFIQSYEHTQVLNHDQHLYWGTSDTDISRMDSAFMAKDLSITNTDRPSLFMDIAMARRHVEIPPPADDGSIHLQEVEVMGTKLDQFYRVFGKEKIRPEEILEKAWAHDVNLRGVISTLINRKKIKSYKKAKKLIEQYGADDAEREALMKIWEQTRGK